MKVLNLNSLTMLPANDVEQVIFNVKNAYNISILCRDTYSFLIINTFHTCIACPMRVKETRTSKAPPYNIDIRETLRKQTCLNNNYLWST